MGAKGVRDVDRGWAAILKNAHALARGTAVKVGVLASDPKGAASEPGGDLTVAAIAAIMEYGTHDGHVPARPWLRPAFDRARERLIALAGKGLLGVLVGDTTVPIVLGQMGATLVSEARNGITAGAGIPPPNAPSTIRRKGSSRPLVDTGRLVGAITWVVLTGAEASEQGAGRVA